jgi:hypothetical protein
MLPAVIASTKTLACPISIKIYCFDFGSKERGKYRPLKICSYNIIHVI